MTMTILAPLDGSPLAERALPFAAWLARTGDATVLLVRASPDVDEAKLAHVELLTTTQVREVADRLAAMAELAHVAELLQEGGISVDTCVPPGDAATLIVETTRVRDAGLIVMATHGRGGLGRALYGSVADRVLCRATVPVMLIGPDCECPWPVDQSLCILVCLDGSPLAEEALGPARGLAARCKATLVLTRVAEPPLGHVYHNAETLFALEVLAETARARRYLDAMAGRLRAAEYAVETRSTVGDAASAIVSTAAEKHVDLIVMATHGRGGLARVVLGSVATTVLQQATVSVLLVRPSALRDRSDTGCFEARAPWPTTCQGGLNPGEQVFSELRKQVLR